MVDGEQWPDCFDTAHGPLQHRSVPGHGWPGHGNDYTAICVILKEKGSILKDVGFMLDDLEALGVILDGEKHVNHDSQTFSWWFKYPKSSFNGAHPRLYLKIDATKSTKCVQKDTGKTKPVYEMVCEE